MNIITMPTNQSTTLVYRWYGQNDIELTQERVSIERPGFRQPMFILTPQQAVNLWLALQTPGIVSMVGALETLWYERLGRYNEQLPAPATDSQTLAAHTGYAVVSRSVGDVLVTVGAFGLIISTPDSGTLAIDDTLVASFYTAYMSGTEPFFTTLDRDLQNAPKSADYYNNLLSIARMIDSVVTKLDTQDTDTQTS